MALRPDRQEIVTDISFFMNETAERGVIVTALTQGSGAAMDDSAAAVQVANATNEKPVGLLLNDVVNLDLTRQHINFAKDEMQQGGKVTILRIGTVVTDQISGSITLGDQAHFMSDGTLASATASSTSAVVGRWLSKKDADGFAKVAINIT
tara:strand:- start:48 stop:500 length:453 start_codon:yes stop_codon:yes gene_type:complete